MSPLDTDRARFIYAPELVRYHYPAGTPMNVQRPERTVQILRSMGLLAAGDGRVVAPTPIDRHALERFHGSRYLDVLEQAAAGAFDPAWLAMGLGTDDCPVFPDMVDHATAVCGASLTAANLVLRGEADIAFNPSGGFHHASSGCAEGFCYLNDLVLACLRLTDAGKRVLYLDLDVHHGDGVQDAFYERDDVMTISLHETGEVLFPGTGSVGEIGAGRGEGFCANVPLPPRTYDAAWLWAFEDVVLPLAEAFAPDALVLQLGMDALKGDPLAHLCLTNNAFVEAIGGLMALGAPIVATGGGGYHVENTARGWALAWTVMRGTAPPADLTLGLGGVMLATTDWLGGLRDPTYLPPDDVRRTVDGMVADTIDEVRAHLFPRHGLSP